MDRALRRIWRRITAEMATDVTGTATPDLVPPAPPATEADVLASLRCWRERQPSPVRDRALDVLLDKLLNLRGKA